MKAREGFISTKAEVKAASVIAGWLKTAFVDLGINKGPGSVRSADASNNYDQNSPLDEILQRGN